MSKTHYNVEFVETGDQLIEAGSAEVTHSDGIDTKAGKMRDGRWIAWVPYYEQPNVLNQDTIRAIAKNKHVATGAVKEYYDD